jgi:hypothetical protein
MKSLEEVTACVVTTGLFTTMAEVMARDCDRVLLFNPECRAFPSVANECIGDGYDEFEKIRDLWVHINEIDVFCFPDIGHAGLQTYLRSIGKPVWGSGFGDHLELGREFFMQMLDYWGLEVPPHTVVEGLEELRRFLEDKEDYYIKVSRFRGDMETHHWRSMELDCGWLDSLAVAMGPMAEHVRFLCFEAIDTELEIGGDTHNVDGKWPTLMLNGFEGKDKTYFSKVTPMEEMPEQVQTIIARISDYLAEVRYRNQISFEIRVKDDKFWWIDATQRGGMPSTGTQHLIWKNFPEIVWAGANGYLVEPEPVAKYSIETMITAKREPNAWERVIIPEELEGLARFNTCCKVDGVYCFPPNEFGGNELGWLVAVGDSPKEVVERQKSLADLLPDGLNADVESLASVIQEIEVAKTEHIPFTTQKMPEPASVL